MDIAATTPPEVTVRGAAELFRTAERATVTVTLGFEGPDREPVLSRTTRGTAALVAGLHDRHSPEDPAAGPVTWFSSDRLRTWVTRPTDRDGRRLDPVHHASTLTRARFRDVAALAAWVEGAAGYPGVSIDGIAWSLTAPTRTELTRVARAAAVADAVDKARAYVEPLGFVDVVCTAIADPGMLLPGTSAGSGGPPPFAGRAAGAPAGGGGGERRLEFTPPDIGASAAVEARFVAVAGSAP
ncbi:SIMPL domain-containing protein [Nocardioides sp.]|uniref:SIMPL domain-containing protein n=1 Tax=Nocardioides sp. TaxID=35761 RepID=UPI003511CAC2